MDTLLYVGQIIVGTLVLVAGLALSGKLPRRFRTPGMAATDYDGAGMTCPSCRFGVFFAVAAVVFGVAGLAGFSPLPAVVGVVVTGLGLTGVLLSAETTPMTYRVTDDAVRVTATPSPGTAGLEVAGLEVAGLAYPARRTTGRSRAA